MKILIRNSDNAVIYAQHDLQLDTEARGNGWRDPNFSDGNARIEDAPLPENWTGAAWAYVSGVWSVINPQAVADIVEAKRKAAIPASVSPRQIRQALTRAGIRATVEAGIAAGSQDMKDWYEFATAFERSHPMVGALAQGLGVTDIDLDNLFTLAGSL